MMKSLTNDHKRRTSRAALAVLKRLAEARRRKGFFRQFVVGEYPRPGESGKWGRLLLAPRGLVEITGYWEKCICPSDCSGGHRDEESPDKVVRPSLRLVREYGLTTKK